jgi:hypothetical protein
MGRGRSGYPNKFPVLHNQLVIATLIIAILAILMPHFSKSIFPITRNSH